MTTTQKVVNALGRRNVEPVAVANTTAAPLLPRTDANSEEAIDATVRHTAENVVNATTMKPSMG